MNRPVILTHKGSEIPGRVINLEQARVRHGDKADHMVRMLALVTRWRTRSSSK